MGLVLPSQCEVVRIPIAAFCPGRPVLFGTCFFVSLTVAGIIRGVATSFLYIDLKYILPRICADVAWPWLRGR